MILRWELRLRRLRRLISRNEWLVRWFGLERSQESPSAPGLVLIQIDGFSRHQLEQALKKRRMPFLRRLLRKERYRLHTMYSGLPSSTPGVQGELFYGVRTVVPAFSFRDAATGNVVRMLDTDAAKRREATLAAQGDGLLSGGSAYCNIYSGGAAEPHFCASTMGWGDMRQQIRPLALVGAVIWHFGAVLRVLGLALLEVVIAIGDMLRGIVVRNEDAKVEFKFIASRLAVSIGLRELATIGAELDVTRGLPVVQVNYLGYDEQSHRRGPSSRFAHWSLKGIDSCIARIWHAARRSAHRDYDIWVYSDHGQEKTIPYNKLTGRSIEEAVGEVFGHVVPARKKGSPKDRGVQSGRAQWLTGRRIKHWIPQPEPAVAEGETPELTTVALGPLGLIYVRAELSDAERARFAQALVDRAKVPAVVYCKEDGHITSCTSRGCFDFPEQADELFGADHPMLDLVKEDFPRLVCHPEAGDFILCGWQPGEPPISFPIENGAHAGPGPEETRAFVMAPVDAPLPPSRVLRPSIVRAAALHRLGRGPYPTESDQELPVRESIRILTYNVHSCVGMDGKLSPARIARVIAQCEPDVVALQEVDVGRRRSGQTDQARVIARELEMECHFHPAMRLAEEEYGDAILSRLPMRLVRAGGLPEMPGMRLEPRGALWVEIMVNGRPLQLINTHLGLLREERMAQAEALLSDEWLSHPDCKSPAVLCGDFNALPRSKVYRRFLGKMHDAQRLLEGHRPKQTFFGRVPLGRIDHVFVSDQIEVVNIEVLRNQLARAASDHLPLLIELRLLPVEMPADQPAPAETSAR